MANIQEEVTSQVWELFLRFFGTGSEFIYQIAHEGNAMLKQGGNFTKEFLLALINKQKELGEPTDATAQMLAREKKGETIHSMLVADEDAAELVAYFKEKKILFSAIESPNDDTKVFMYMSGDSEKVADIVSLWQAERGLVSEITPKLFLDNFAKEGVGTLSGLDRVDLELFRRYAKENGLIYAATEAEEKDRYVVIYDPKDKAVAEKTMGAVAWAFSGEAGALLREQMVIFMRNRQQLNRAFLEAEKEYYIVSGKNPEHYIHLTANDFTYYKNTKEVKNAERNREDFLDSGMRVVDGMAQPVLLTREEFEVYKSENELDKELIAKTVAEKAGVLPGVDAVKEAQDKQMRKLSLIQEKMALDDESTAGFWIYDDSIDFAGGGNYEALEDLDEQLKVDLSAARTRAKQYQFYEVGAVDNRSLDYFIAEAEKQRRQPEPEKQEKDRDR